MEFVKINKRKYTILNDSFKHEYMTQDLYVDIKNYLTEINNSTYTHELDSFFALVKKHHLLKLFKLFFKKNKFLTPINYTNYGNSLGHLSKDKIENFLTHLLISHTNLNPYIFYITFNDGFTINFDYVQNIEKKIDIKQNYNDELHMFYTELSLKYGYKYKPLTYKYRATLNIRDKAKQINFEQIESAIKANIIHAFDSYFIRQFIIQSTFPCITIHDCVGCDLSNYQKINPLMCKIYGKIIIITSDGDEVILTNQIQSDYLLI